MVHELVRSKVVVVKIRLGLIMLRIRNNFGFILHHLLTPVMVSDELEKEHGHCLG